MPKLSGHANRIPLFPVLAIGLLLSACGDFGQMLGAGAAAGGAAQTADAATQAALNTEVARGARQPLLDILDVTLTAHTCAEHDSDMVGDYDCSYTVAFTLAYESKDYSRAQCFFSNAESEKMNQSPGAGQTTIEVTYDVLVFAPGTTFNGFCQLRDQASDEVIAQDGGPVGGWDIEVPAP
ncbi:MAG: hypothetical protein WD751_11620 [Anaerolineales bacterium]